VLTTHHFRLPKELILFFKNLLYLMSFAASVAPEADLLSQIAPVLRHFTRKYASELPDIIASGPAQTKGHHGSIAAVTT
jgi:ubiquinone biosynthesis protein